MFSEVKMIKVNEYYEGRVKSLGNTLNNIPFTVGIIEPGEYSFSTEKKEHMTIVYGSMLVRLPDETDFKEYKKGETFIVEPNKSFTVKINSPVSYLCEYF